MYAIRGAFTVMLNIGTGSPGDLRAGADSRLARSTTFPSASKASRTTGVPVDPQKDTVTEATGFGYMARTGIDSVAIAQTRPLWPLERCVKNISIPFPFV